MAHLRLFRGNRPQRFELAEDCCVIGRHHDCQIHLDDDSVSRRHARIVRQGDRFVLEDMGSRNKTYLNGNPVQGPTVLSDNDIIRICNHHIIFLSDPTEDSKHQIVITSVKEDSTRITLCHDAEGSSDLGLDQDARPREKLEALLEINRTVAAVLRTDALTSRVLESLMMIFPQSERVYILLRGEDGEVIPKSVKTRQETTDQSVRISRTVLQQVLDEGRALLAEDAYLDPQLASRGSIADYRIHSIMCVPLKTDSARPFGAIWLHTEDRHRRFSEEDLDLLVSIAGMIALALERARLHEALMLEDRIQNEILAGKAIQQTFLPIDWPFIPGYRFYASYEPAQTVGGDYYGFIQVPGDRLVISLGDVSGKGLSAALLMARLSSELRFVAINHQDPTEAVRSLDRIIQGSWPAERFLTLLYMVMDLNDHSLTIVNAGHMPPLFRSRDGGVYSVTQEQAGPPLNSVQDFNYEATALSFKHGGTVLAYTDGVTDARDPSGASFGLDRLRRAFGDGPADSSRAGEAVIQAVRRFSEGCPQFDDITLVCFGRDEE